MKIAIIGSGVAGLTSAYLLSPHHDVSIYEKADCIGGHAHTLHIKEGNSEIDVDNGFMVFNPDKYPFFVSLLNDLGVKSVNTVMSFGVNIPGQVSYRGDVPMGIFANRSNLINIRFWKFLFEIVRFRSIAKKSLKQNLNTTETLGEFLSKNNFGPDLANWFIYPMLAAIWSIKDSAKVEDFPAISTFVFLNNHKLLNNTQPTWKTIPGGSIEYVSRIRDSIENNGGKFILKSKINNIKRTKHKVTVQDNNSSIDYDYIIFATHADTTKYLLSDATEAEISALSMFKYSINKTVVHKDISLIPSNQRLLSSWNYSMINNGRNEPMVSFTYCMNILQHIPKHTPVLITLNPHQEINKNMIYSQETYEHPQYNNLSLKGQEQIKKLQGKNRTYFTGAHLGYGFHEDGVASAVYVANLLGINTPW